MTIMVPYDRRRFGLDQTRAAKIAATYGADLPLFPQVEEALRAAAANLVATFLPDSGEYAAEKLVKSFTEKIRYEATILLQQEAINPAQLAEVMGRIGREELQKRLARAEARLRSSLAREVRHFTSFLADVQQEGMRLSRSGA